MGKKDAQGMHSAPVDTYRKQIGKHDYKKSKAEVRMLKDKSQMKKSALGVKDVLKLLGGFIVLLIGLYLMLYVSISKKEKVPEDP